MKRIYYEKIGRKYVPVSEYDDSVMDSFPKGNHLVMCYPGGKSTRYNINPNYAAMIAAGHVAEDAICSSISKALEMRPQRTLITEGQKKAWKKLAKEFGNDLCPLMHPSVHDGVDAGIKAMITEAEKLLTNPAVKKAYEQFILVCQLTKDEQT